MINTIVVEDNAYIQKHFMNLLDAARFRVVDSFRDAFEAEEACRDGNIDLVLMDVQTYRNHSGLAAGKRIRQKYRRTKVVIVTSLIDPAILEQAKQGAADSLWYKDHGDDEIMDVIERTLNGERIFPDSSPRVEMKEMFSSDITPRQMEILRRFVYGMTYEEIAEDLKLTKRGVRWNLDQIVEKGGFQNKHELLAVVIENRLIVTTLEE